MGKQHKKELKRLRTENEKLTNLNIRLISILSGELCLNFDKQNLRVGNLCYLVGCHTFKTFYSVEKCVLIEIKDGIYVFEPYESIYLMATGQTPYLIQYEINNMEIDKFVFETKEEADGKLLELSKI